MRFQRAMARAPCQRRDHEDVLVQANDVFVRYAESTYDNRTFIYRINVRQSDLYQDRLGVLLGLQRDLHTSLQRYSRVRGFERLAAPLRRCWFHRLDWTLPISYHVRPSQQRNCWVGVDG